MLAHDLENDPDVVALIGASAALTISGIPFLGPIGAARVGYADGEFILNPRVDDIVDSDLNLVVAGTREGVLMVESEASELSEDVMLGAVMVTMPTRPITGIGACPGDVKNGICRKRRQNR